VIRNNDRAIAVYGGKAIVEDTIVTDNGAGIVALFAQAVEVRRCTISKNGYGITTDESAPLHAIDSIVRENVIADVFAKDASVVEIEASDVGGGWPGAGNIDVDPQFVDANSGEFGLLATSPCIDAASSAYLASGVDLSGMPRVLDGDLDGSMRLDMGALEFGNGRLLATADGSGAQISVSGTAGMTAVLIAGVSPGELFLAPWGALLVDLSHPFVLLRVGAIPVTLQSPATGLSGLTIEVQAIVVAPGAAAGNSTNGAMLTFP
jgi:hypothetical protein